MANYQVFINTENNIKFINEGLMENYEADKQKRK